MAKKIILYFLVLTMLLSMMISEASALPVSWITLKEKSNISLNKTWVLDLSTDVKDGDIIGVVVEKGGKYVPVWVQVNGKKISITPATPFDSSTKYNLRIFSSSGKYYMIPFVTMKEADIAFDGTKSVVLRIDANPAKGFNWPYFLFIPKDIRNNKNIHLLVEPNNTGTTNDDIKFHEKAAKELIEYGVPREFANRLNIPLLVPIITRPDFQFDLYTHALNRGTLISNIKEYKRLDLQLISMIDDARAKLKSINIDINAKVFMSGFSASGQFVNRFAVLHPERVRAIASGGFNSLPLLPLKEWQGKKLPYPIGIYDIANIANINFNMEAYKKVSQYLYMGYLDQNDAAEYRDSFSEEQAQLIFNTFGKDLMKRWDNVKKIYKEMGLPAQLVTYNNTNHEIKKEMIDDIVKFFEANSGDKITTIKPYDYPFVELVELTKVTITEALWKGDKGIASFHADNVMQNGTFIIKIAEWNKGQDYQQLNKFLNKSGFAFTLVAKGYPDIEITENNLAGTFCSGQGDYQGFVVKLAQEQLNKMASKVPYTIKPNIKSNKYYFTVKSGVYVVKP